MLDIPPCSFSLNPVVSRNYDKAKDLMDTNRDAAIDILKNNCDMECTSSMVLLGVIMSNGTPEEREYSISLFETATSYGNSYGIRNLAYCCAIGLNCIRNKPRAVELYVKSARKGNAKAACNAGVMYEYGNGVDKDLERAFEFYLFSAEKGCTRGMTNLGEMYYWGNGTKKNIPQAIKWLTESDSPRALYRLSEIYFNEEGYIDAAKGMDALKKSAEQGYSKALYRYGRYIEDTDFDIAVNNYNRAAEKGNSDAANRLVELGLPVPESIFGKRKKKSS